MIVRRRCPSAAGGPPFAANVRTPSPSGPRWASVSVIAATSRASSLPANPQIPHTERRVPPATGGAGAPRAVTRPGATIHRRARAAGAEQRSQRLLVGEPTRLPLRVVGAGDAGVLPRGRGAPLHARAAHPRGGPLPALARPGRARGGLWDGHRRRAVRAR